MNNNTINVNFIPLTSGSMALAVQPTTVMPSALRLQPASAATIFANVEREEKIVPKSVIFPLPQNIEMSISTAETKNVAEKSDINIINITQFSTVVYDNAGQKLIVDIGKFKNIANKGKSIPLTSNTTELPTPIEDIQRTPSMESAVESSIEVISTAPILQKEVEPKVIIGEDDKKIEFNDVNTTGLIESVLATVDNIKKDRELYMGMSDKNKELNEKIATLASDTDILRQKNEEHMATMEVYLNSIKNVRDILSKLADAAKLKAEEERKKEELLKPAVSKAEEDNKTAKLTEAKSKEKCAILAAQADEITKKTEEIAEGLGIPIPTKENEYPVQNGKSR